MFEFIEFMVHATCQEREGDNLRAPMIVNTSRRLSSPDCENVPAGSKDPVIQELLVVSVSNTNKPVIHSDDDARVSRVRWAPVAPSSFTDP